MVSASVYAGSEPPRVLGDPTTQMGSAFSMPALAMIGAVALVAGIRYLRNKRS